MNIDRVMLIIAIAVIAVFYGLVFVHSVIVDPNTLWKLPLALAALYALQLAIGAAIRRFSLGKDVEYFLSTAPFAAWLTLSVNFMHGAPASYAKSFLVIEGVLLALAAVFWPFVRKRAAEEA